MNAARDIAGPRTTARPRTKLMRIEGARMVEIPLSIRPSAVSQREWDAMRRINDAIIDRVSYDHARAGDPTFQGVQAPRETLRRGLGVCMDYAALFEASARRQKFDVKSLVSASLNHAWNAVRFGGQWWFVDVTWNAGDIFEGGGSVPTALRKDSDFRCRFLLTTNDSEVSMVNAGLARQTHSFDDIREVHFAATLRAMKLIAEIRRLLEPDAERSTDLGERAMRFTLSIGENEARVADLYEKYQLLESRYPLAVGFRLDRSARGMQSDATARRGASFGRRRT